MFQKKFMEMVYRKAKKPSDLLWHSEEPSPFLIDVIQKRKVPGKALDVGCGAGVFSIYLAKAGYEVTGIDFIHEAIQMATQLANEHHVSIKLLQQDILTWSTEDKFDIILDSGCLHTISDKYAFKKKIIEWLSPDGDFILGHFGRRNFFDWRPMGPIRRSRQDLEELFKPELVLRKYEQRIQENVPLPIGTSVQLQSLWFNRK
jgi:2-polyprenyl-3-methyl-5-hydroxy-6-metoxy-1,4-benzoquinol methylase